MVKYYILDSIDRFRLTRVAAVGLRTRTASRVSQSRQQSCPGNGTGCICSSTLDKPSHMHYFVP